MGYTQISQKFLKAYSQTYSQTLPELLSIASVLLAKRRMLTCHEGKGWGFQAGVLKGDFAHSQLGVFAILPIIVGTNTNTPNWVCSRFYLKT